MIKPGRALLLLTLLLPACSPACFLKPNSEYDPSALAAPPDYDASTSWAALPEAPGKASFTPPGQESSGQASADVFFVHPTTYFSRDVWNDPLTNEATNVVVSQVNMPGQASVFNACCRIFAPRYRQASISAFYGELSQAKKAFGTAYDDVDRAFSIFLTRHNAQRPFIIAAHSQGSMHAMRLLERVDADPALRERFVAAYIPGFALPLSHYEQLYTHLKPCTEPAQLGCIASWDSYKEGAETTGHHPHKYWRGQQLLELSPQAPRQCTNPVSWRMDARPSAKQAHLGAVELENQGEAINFRKLVINGETPRVNITGLKPPQAGLVSVQCKDGFLRVPDLDELDYPELTTEPGNYHMLDYELFYMDIRANALARVRAWEAR